ncbi:RNA polymerase sigma factor [uncultured Paraglaciecola sp.]|uniref:RNA polymerase sigma factor n=1 Tax=uncultured Paraglaciecola sp. TaxID=1765024 RepID=UPI0030DB72A0|tara:strand:- start:125513 stop:126055 length:543 start_codon:yes stop_codon:yes gene_type:complete
MTKISQIFIDNSDFLKRFLMKYLKSEQAIEDIVQEVYIKAHNAALSKEIEYPKAFLFTIAKNLALNELNKKSLQRTVYLEDSNSEEHEPIGATLEQQIDANKSVEIYCKAMADLPEKCRKVFLLRKIHGLKHQTIATELGISLSSVEKHLKTAMLSCRDYLKRHQIDLHGVTTVEKKQLK